MMVMMITHIWLIATQFVIVVCTVLPSLLCYDLG